MWRYRELMPLLPGDDPVTLGEGFTPLLHAQRLGATLGLERLFIKDESLNPTNSFKARGQSAAITRAKALGAHTIALPTAGNAGNAAAAYSAAAGLDCQVFIPKDAKQPFIDECRLYGAHVTLVDWPDHRRRRAWPPKQASRSAGTTSPRSRNRTASKARRPWATSWPNNSTGRCPIGSSIPPAAAPAWSGCGRPSRDGSHRLDRLKRRPRMVSVQPDGCAPIVRAFQQGDTKAAPWENAHTAADGLRVPRAIGDFLILRRVRESGGTALAVTDDEMVHDMLEIGSLEGVSAAPEGGAALSALRRAGRRRQDRPRRDVVLFNTGGALKYLDVLRVIARAEARACRSVPRARSNPRTRRRSRERSCSRSYRAAPSWSSRRRPPAGSARCPAGCSRPCGRTRRA